MPPRGHPDLWAHPFLLQLSYLLKVMLDFLDKEAELAPVVDPRSERLTLYTHPAIDYARPRFYGDTAAPNAKQRGPPRYPTYRGTMQASDLR